MNKTKYLLTLLGTTFLLTACAGTTNEVEETAGSDPAVSESVEVEDSSVAETSSEPVESESIESSAESQPAESESAETDTSAESVGESTELNEDEAALIEEAKQAISEQTGFVEGQGHLFLIDGVEGQVVQINIREDNEEVASNLGLFRYDAETGTLYEQDILTGEFVEYPAKP